MLSGTLLAKKNRYAKILLSTTRKLIGMKKAAVDVYMALLEFANWHDGSCFPSYKAIERLGVCRRSISEGLKQLEAAGLIERCKTAYKANHYTLFGIYTLDAMGHEKDLAIPSLSRKMK